jgi:hypothetical protein
MAGFYPDTPDHKIFYNDDGSIVFTQPATGGAVTLVAGSSANTLNGEGNANAAIMSTNTRIGCVFAQRMDIVGVYNMHSGISGTDGVLRTSTDTTNGTDGTWTTVTATLPTTGESAVNATTRWRTDIQTVSCLGIKGVTLSAGSNGDARNFHLYGRPTTGANPDRLRFWHPTTDTELLGSHFDYGDLARGSSKIIQFRVKNNSTTKTANTITVADDALTAASPTLASQTTFSPDGTTNFLASLAVGSLAPGALSAIVYARISLTASAAIGPWRQRFKATAATWS